MNLLNNYYFIHKNFFELNLTKTVELNIQLQNRNNPLSMNQKNSISQINIFSFNTQEKTAVNTKNRTQNKCQDKCQNRNEIKHKTYLNIFNIENKQ